MKSTNRLELPVFRFPHAPGLARTISLFNRQSTPSPLALVHLTRLEADANANSKDVDKQVALWTELMKYPAGQKRVLARYERLLEFDKHSPLLRSSRLFQFYVHSLLATNQAASVDAAVRQRDSILELPLPEPEPEAPPLTASQQIAKDVVANAAAKSTVTNWAQALKGRLSNTAAATPLTGSSEETATSGGKANPVHVVLEERESLWALLASKMGISNLLRTARGNLLYKGLRFVFFTCLFLFISLTVLSMVLESTGITRAAAPSRNMEFDPGANQKIYKFTDVHGVDEAKEVSIISLVVAERILMVTVQPTIGFDGDCSVLEGSYELFHAWRSTSQGRSANWATGYWQDSFSEGCCWRSWGREWT